MNINVWYIDIDIAYSKIIFIFDIHIEYPDIEYIYIQIGNNIGNTLTFLDMKLFSCIVT